MNKEKKLTSEAAKDASSDPSFDDVNEQLTESKKELKDSSADAEEIVLPRQLYEKLDPDLEMDEVEVTDIAKDSFTLRAVNKRPQSDYAARWFLLPTFLASVIFLIFACFHLSHKIPLSGTDSIAGGVLFIANAVAFVTFILAYIARRKDLYHSMTRKVYWRTFPVVLASYLMVVTLIIIGFFWFLDLIFHGAIFDVFTSTLIFAIFAGIINYFVIFLVDNWSPTMLVNFMIVVVLGGLISSMATNGNPYWWQHNFSFLGTTASKASWQFNLTLVISAALLLGLVDYIFVSIAQKLGKSFRHLILRILLSGCALAIAGVGLIPNNGLGLAHFWHDQISMFIFYFIAVAILGIRWLLPEAPKSFIHISYGIFGLVIIVYFLWHPLRYFYLTTFEIMSFALCFLWLMLFVNTLFSMLWKEKKRYRVITKD